jgi:16S rRNA (guanine527-N7)-methyltransferase
VTAAPFRDRIVGRAARANIAIASADLERLAAYFELLSVWNRTINLTALALEPASDEAIDRLLVEPLAAVSALAGSPLIPDWTGLTWMDLGSGGGSPAIPMKIVLRDCALTMVESKSRKVAFLREAVRTLALRGAAVVNARLDEIHGPASTDLMTVRAVRLDQEFATVAARLLRNGGVLAAFQPSGESARLSLMDVSMAVPLVPDGLSWLHLYRCVPRGTIDKAIK